jgi:hypothetical protein
LCENKKELKEKKVAIMKKGYCTVTQGAIARKD